MLLDPLRLSSACGPWPVTSVARKSARYNHRRSVTLRIVKLRSIRLWLHDMYEPLMTPWNCDNRTRYYENVVIAEDRLGALLWDQDPIK